MLWPQVLPWGPSSRAYSSLAPFLPGEETRGARAGRADCKGIFGEVTGVCQRDGELRLRRCCSTFSPSEVQFLRKPGLLFSLSLALLDLR